MPDKDPPQATPPPASHAVPGHPGITRRTLIRGILRSAGIVAAALVVYAWLPANAVSGVWTIVVIAIGGLLGMGWEFVRQVRRISASPQPGVAAVEALALVFGLFLTLFAFLYLYTDHASPGSFSEPMDKMAGLYFSVTVMSTVGFGDITAVSTSARALVTLQMVLDMILIGAAVKILLGTAKRAVTTLHASS